MRSLIPVSTTGWRRFAIAGLLAGASMFSMSASAVTISSPTVTGPIPASVPPGDPSRDYPFLASQYDLKKAGYVEEEFFIEGTANRYLTPTLATGSVVSSGHPFKTRIIVRRPEKPRRFNGVVVLEWQNVTAGYELDAHWFASYHHFMREGFVWVGVSAQRVGLESSPIYAVQQGLKQWSPSRYGSLDVTAGGTVLDDSLSYDVYAAAAMAIRNPTGVNPLGPLPSPTTILAAGASQSAGRLTVLHNSIYPLYEHKVFDAFYFLVGGGPFRTDLDVRAFQLLSETDVLGSIASPRPADSNVFRRWDVAGTSHSSQRLASGIEPLYERDGIVAAPTDCLLPPRSRIPFHKVHDAAYNHLAKWSRRPGYEPPIAPPLDFDMSTTPPTLRRDEHGNALGGIQLAEHAVPTATNTGVNTARPGGAGGVFCRLYGSHEPFDRPKLDALYPNHGDYVSKVVAKTRENVDVGYIPHADGQDTIQEAVHSDIGM